MRRDTDRLSLWCGVALGLLLAPALPARAEEPVQACARLGTADTPQAIPTALVPAARRLFHLDAPAEVVQRMAIFRCFEGAVLLCNLGANLPCGKANTDRALPAAGRYCRENPGTSFIPMVVTGHDTVYRWRCAGPEAVAGEPAESLDSSGFIARLWKPLD